MNASVAIQVLPEVKDDEELIRVVFKPEGDVLTIEKKVTKHHI